MTANLDGETALKCRTSANPYNKFSSLEEINRLKCVIETEKPVPYLYRFSGKISKTNPNGDIENYPLGPDHLLPRGAELKNTSWVIGCAVYLGQSTKMSLNFIKRKPKVSRLERYGHSDLIKCLAFYLLFFLQNSQSISVVLCSWPHIDESYFSCSKVLLCSYY